jgi:NAD(P)-dependent dehydrogenase (short-subunit alcohol dehydrogenase family)
MIEGQVALVTGGAQGIGRYAAHTLARAGAKLVVADIGPLEQITRELTELDTEVLALTADVRDEEQVAAMVAQAGERFGRIDVLVNNAGIVTHFGWMPRWAPIREMERSFWDRVLDTNLGGTFLCTKHVLPTMEAQGGGHIINLHGGTSGVGAAAYNVSKDAIRTFTRFVAEEERDRNVCVLAVSPGGAIATEEAPATVLQSMPGPEAMGELFVLSSQAPMELSGKLVRFRDGQLVAAS